MGYLAISELETEVRSHLGGRTDLDDRILTFLALAQLRILRVNDLDELNHKVTTATVTSQATNTIPTTGIGDSGNGVAIREIKSLVVQSSDGRSKTIERLHYKEFDQRFPEPSWDAEGFPEFYMLWPETETPTITWYPIPDAAYNFYIRYNYWPQRPGSDTYQLSGGDYLTPLYIDDLVLNLSISIAYQTLGREDKAKEYFGIYAAQAREAKQLKAEDFDTSMNGIRVGDFDLRGNYWADPFIRSV
jgi:hypothetical protein